VRHDFLDRYSRENSPVHRLSTGTKAACAVTMIIVSVAFQEWWVLTLLLVILLVALGFSGLPPGFVFRRIALFEPAIAAMALAALVRPDGLHHFLGILARGTFAISTMVILANTTPFASLLQLLRRLRVAPILITVLALLYRYLFILIDEAERIQRARRARTFIRWRRWGVLATVVEELFVRSTERAERVFLAMRARGWQ
jgi:cobalt/nickel transport system permease protein